MLFAIGSGLEDSTATVIEDSLTADGGFAGNAILGYSPFNFSVKKNLPYLLCSPDTASIFVGRFLELASIGSYSW